MKSLIKDEQWAIILDRLREINGIHTSDEARLRRFIDAVLYIRNAGCKWRNLPEALLVPNSAPSYHGMRSRTAHSLS